MSNKVYVLQVSDGEDPKLLSKIITTVLPLSKSFVPFVRATGVCTPGEP